MKALKAAPMAIRLWLLTGILAFVACFNLIYFYWLTSLADFDTAAQPTWCIVLAWVLSVLPALWMPIRLSRPSQLMYWVLYLTVFVPSMFVPLYLGQNRRGEIVTLMLTLFAGMAITGSSYLFRPRSASGIKLSTRTFWIALALVTSCLAMWVLAVLGPHLRIVSFSDIYDLRFAAVERERGTLLPYATMWLSAVIGPVLMALGLVRKKLLVFLCGVAIQVLVYSAEGAKSVIVSIVVIPTVYLLLRYKDKFGLTFTWANAFLLVVLFLASLTGISVVLPAIVYLVFMRVFGNSGLMTGQYYYFFQQNPLTYYSHVSGISRLIHYPYQGGIGQEIGYYYAGNPEYNANAHFWATDGIAAIGLPGILLISVLCAFVFWVLDSAASKHDIRFTAPLVTFSALNISNLSLFTTLLSGGLAAIIFMLWVMPSESNRGKDEHIILSDRGSG